MLDGIRNSFDKKLDDVDNEMMQSIASVINRHGIDDICDERVM